MNQSLSLIGFGISLVLGPSSGTSTSENGLNVDFSFPVSTEAVVLSGFEEEAGAIAGSGSTVDMGVGIDGVFGTEDTFGIGSVLEIVFFVKLLFDLYITNAPIKQAINSTNRIQGKLFDPEDLPYNLLSIKRFFPDIS